MRHPRWFYAAAAILFAIPLIWLDSGPVDAQPHTGAIQGRVTFSGTPPSPTMLTEDGDSQPVLYLDGSGGLRYAVVYVPDAPKSTTPIPPPATMNQRRFMFEPQVLAVRAGQDRVVDVRPAETTRLDVSFTSSDVGMPRH